MRLSKPSATPARGSDMAEVTTTGPMHPNVRAQLDQMRHEWIREIKKNNRRNKRKRRNQR